MSGREFVWAPALGGKQVDRLEMAIPRLLLGCLRHSRISTSEKFVVGGLTMQKWLLHRLDTLELLRIGGYRWLSKNVTERWNCALGS